MIPEEDELKAREAECNASENEVLPYEFCLITGGERNVNNIKKAVERLVALKEGKLKPEEMDEEEDNMINAQPATHSSMFEDPFLKYKEHEREKQRERRLKIFEEERQHKFERRLDDLLKWEDQRHRLR